MSIERKGTGLAGGQARLQIDTVPGAFPGEDEEPAPANPALSLARAVKLRKAEYIRPRRLNIRIGTWNVAAITGTEADVGGWFTAAATGGGAAADDRAEQTEKKHDTPATAIEQLRDATNETRVDGGEYAAKTTQSGVVDLYVLGLQEIVDINSPAEALRPFTDSGPSTRWKDAVHSAIPAYNLVASQQLVGLLLLVFASPAITPQVTSVSSCAVGTGLMGYMGNKGAVCTRLVVGGTTRLVFVNCHLSAGNDEASLARRNWDASQILQRVSFDPVREEDEVFDDDSPRSVPGQSNKLGDEEFAFWLGDFNYRLEDIPGDDLRRLLHLHTQGQQTTDQQIDGPEHDVTDEPDELTDLPPPESFAAEEGEDRNGTNGGVGDADDGLDDDQLSETELDPTSDPASLETTLASLLPHDQLRRQQMQKRAFHEGWREGPITFLPTYKYDIGEVGVFDTSKKQRAPSWCDRILYRTMQDVAAYEQDRLKEQQAKDQQEQAKQATDSRNGPTNLNKPLPARPNGQQAEKGIIFDYDDETGDVVPQTSRASQESEPASVKRDLYDYDEDADEERSRETDDKGEGQAPVLLTRYESVQQISSSDHKPVVADFLLSIDAVDPQLKSTVSREVVWELDRTENELRPSITVVIDPLPPRLAESQAGGRSTSKTPAALRHDEADQDVVHFGEIYYGTPKARTMTIANTGGVDAVFRFFDPSNPEGQDAESPFWLAIQPDAEATQVSLSPAVYLLPPGAATTITLTIDISDANMLRTLNMSREPYPEIEYVIVLKLKRGRDHFIPLSGTWMRTGVPVERPSTAHKSLPQRLR
ncbi:hypothetical protein KEM52_006201 [Ascosphaera acerosa]|nr:hypothetical protein KEM52_006201 [Ascosphaera acerosa]